MSFLELANSKVKDGMYPLQRSVSRMRESYSAYSKGRYRFLAATCSQAHFFVVDVTFNLEHSRIFEKVTVYDLLRKMPRRKDGVD